MKNLLSETAKMPCYSTSHAHCGIGEKLKNISGSVCSKCYGDKGFYCYHTKKLQDKTQYIKSDLQDYIFNLEKQIASKVKIDKINGEKYFRFHDKGDFISFYHFKAVMELCYRLKDINFWVPTKSINYLRQYIKEGYSVPDNVTIRVSSFMINKSIRLDKILNRFPIASVYIKGLAKLPDKSFLCVTNEKGNCGNCRQCWNKNTREIVYLLH